MCDSAGASRAQAVVAAASFLPLLSRAAQLTDLRVTSSGRHSGADSPERRGREWGEKGIFFFWTFNKRLFEMLKMPSSFVSNHRNTCVYVYIYTHTHTNYKSWCLKYILRYHNFNFPPKAEKCIHSRMHRRQQAPFGVSGLP